MPESRVLSDQLRDKALLALEDAIQECRYRTPRPSFATKFALAYLWAYSGGDRQPSDELWRCLRADRTPWSFGSASNALGSVYEAVGIARPDDIAWEMWARWWKHEGIGGGGKPRK